MTKYCSDMEHLAAIAKALADESRLRALMLLCDGELCLCQVIAVLGLSPATVSKHMSVLRAAGLIRRRKQGRWHYYRLAGIKADPAARSALRWVRQHARADQRATDDRARRCCVTSQDLSQVAACYTSA